MAIGWDDALVAGSSFFGNMFGGGGGQNNPGYPGVMVLPGQRTLLQDMLAKYYLGQGDYGQAGAMREGRDTLYNEAAAAGIPIGSGVVQGALANRFGQAAQQSGLQRMLYGLQLAQASPAFANTTENFGYGKKYGSPHDVGLGDLSRGPGQGLYDNALAGNQIAAPRGQSWGTQYQIPAPRTPSWGEQHRRGGW